MRSLLCLYVKQPGDTVFPPPRILQNDVLGLGSRIASVLWTARIPPWRKRKGELSPKVLGVVEL